MSSSPALPPPEPPQPAPGPETPSRRPGDWPWVATALIAVGLVFLVVHRWSIGAVLVVVGLVLIGRWRTKRLRRDANRS